MNNNNHFEVIIVGGSYSGLAAAMALGRALRKVMIIDSGKACNRQTPYSHNFLTQDGKTPGEISATGKEQALMYNSVSFFSDVATQGVKTQNGFEIKTASGGKFTARKLIFASGIGDILYDIPGFSACWGISVLHCPYCHGYEVRNQQTGVIGNGEYGFELSALISNWTNDLTLYTNGKSTITSEQKSHLEEHNISIEEAEIKQLVHQNGYLQYMLFKNDRKVSINVLYARSPFVQHCAIPEIFGCEITAEGYIQTDASLKTSVHGIFACGDNTTRLRTIANAVSMGATAGMMVNKELIEESFYSIK
ncbi:MAG: NAD(P)/FAD-dependent oxidoreductase [Chitinophagaceae bacterium]